MVKPPLIADVDNKLPSSGYATICCGDYTKFVFWPHNLTAHGPRRFGFV